MTLVIDASVALKWVLDEADSEAADGLLDETLIAPSLWLVEAANALWRRRLRGEISQSGAQARLTALFDAPVTSLALEDDLAAALELAAQLRHPVYDCLYLAAALRHDVQVVTADARFLAATAIAFPQRVRML
jgi:predicted nucleic acid-binding protein